MLDSGSVCGYAYAYADAGTMLVFFVAMPATMPMPVSAQCLPAVVFMAMPMMHPSGVVCGCAYEYVGIVPAYGCRRYSVDGGSSRISSR